MSFCVQVRFVLSTIVVEFGFVLEDTAAVYYSLGFSWNVYGVCYFHFELGHGDLQNGFYILGLLYDD